MAISMQFNNIDMSKYILGHLKLVWGLMVHKCTHKCDVYSDFDQK